jgi:hypothetical protein
LRFERAIEWWQLSSRWPDDQKIYIGSEWLDLDVRRFARKLAAEIAREAAERSSNAFRVNQTSPSGNATNTGATPPTRPQNRRRWPSTSPNL